MVGFYPLRRHLFSFRRFQKADSPTDRTGHDYPHGGYSHLNSRQNQHRPYRVWLILQHYGTVADKALRAAQIRNDRPYRLRSIKKTHCRQTQYRIVDAEYLFYRDQHQQQRYHHRTERGKNQPLPRQPLSRKDDMRSSR